MDKESLYPFIPIIGLCLAKYSTRYLRNPIIFWTSAIIQGVSIVALLLATFKIILL